MSSASASILVNGSPTEEFRLERGLRQGDSLSPFLYLLVAEGPSIMISKATEMGIYEAAEVRSDKIKISHLQYADDTIFVGSASASNAGIMKLILRNFELLSGLKVNFDKCSVMGVNVDRGRLETMATSLGCVVGDIPFSYLGVRVEICQKSSNEWMGLIQKFRKRLKLWEDRKISFGGRITLLKSVLSSLPIYHFSFYSLPKKKH